MRTPLVKQWAQDLLNQRNNHQEVNQKWPHLFDYAVIRLNIQIKKQDLSSYP